MTRYKEAADARALAIGQAAEATGLGVKTIHYYEEIGLNPRTRRRANGGQGAGRRVFTAADIGRLGFIRMCGGLDGYRTAVNDAWLI